MMPMDVITPTSLADATGISLPYASQIISGKRIPPRSLAIHIFRRTGWRASIIEALSDEDMATLERIEPWAPKREQAA